MPFKKGKYRQQGKGKLGQYHATHQGTSVVRTAPAAASSASAAADRVGDDRGGSGASSVNESGSAEAIAADALELMNPPNIMMFYYGQIRSGYCINNKTNRNQDGRWQVCTTERKGSKENLTCKMT